MENFTTFPQKARRLYKARTWAFAPLLLVFVACNPPGAPKDDGGNGALQSWVKGMSFVSTDFSAGRALGANTQIEITFHRKLQSVDSSKIQGILTRKFTDNDGTEKNGVVSFLINSSTQPTNPNKVKVNLNGFTLALVTAVDDNGNLVSFDTATLLGELSGITNAGTLANPSLTGSPILKSGDRFTLSLNAGALTDENGNLNEKQNPSQVLEVQ